MAERLNTTIRKNLCFSVLTSVDLVKTFTFHEEPTDEQKQNRLTSLTMDGRNRVYSGEPKRLTTLIRSD